MRTMISSLKCLGRCAQAPVLLQGHISYARTVATNATYYDSQSGEWVAVHEEQEISVFYNARTEKKIPENLQIFNGLILPKNQEHDVESLLKTTSEGFQIFTDSKSEGPSDKLNFMVDFDPSDPENLKETLHSHVQNGSKTMIRLGDKCFNADYEPIMVANDVAALIDATKAGNYLWVTNDEPLDDTDPVIQLCEELQYLDIPGATIKSRLVVDVMGQDIVDETMLLGVNKFVITDKEQMGTVQEIAEEQGKTLLAGE